MNLKSDPDAIQKDKLTLENRLVDRFSSGEPITVEEWIDFHLSIEKLSEDEQKVFQMMFYGQLTDLKVAELLGCSDRTVRRLWRNARLKLQQMINEKRSG
jgi:RNA polymerase sigma factor (sigma-70 family)